MSQHIGRYSNYHLTKCIISRQLGTSFGSDRQKKPHDGNCIKLSHFQPLPFVIKEQTYRSNGKPNNIYLGQNDHTNNLSRRPEQKIKNWKKPVTCLWDISHGTAAQSSVIQDYITQKSVEEFAARHEKMLKMKTHATRVSPISRRQRARQNSILEVFERFSIGQANNFLDELLTEQTEDLSSTRWRTAGMSSGDNGDVISNIEMKSFVYSTVETLNSDMKRKKEKPLMAEHSKCEDKGLSEDTSKDKGKDNDKPSLEQLRTVENLLVEKLPKFFRGSFFCGKEHAKIIFVNKYYGKDDVYIGKISYFLQMLKVFLKVRIVCPSVTVNLLSVTINEEDSTVNVRWQIQTLPFYAPVFHGVMVLFGDADKNAMLRFYDGYSIFKVGKDGLIHVHEVDRKIRDNSVMLSKLKERLAGKLIPKLQGNMPSMCCKETDKAVIPGS